MSQLFGLELDGSPPLPALVNPMCYALALRLYSYFSLQEHYSKNSTRSNQLTGSGGEDEESNCSASARTWNVDCGSAGVEKSGPCGLSGA